MDEAVYKRLLTEVGESLCVFEKAILTGCASCACAGRLQVAEREIVACQQPASHARCAALHGYLRHSFNFALGNKPGDAPLPHAQEMRIQCGGLMGLQQTLNHSAEVKNVAALLERAIEQWGGLDALPYSDVIQAAARCYQGRHA